MNIKGRLDRVGEKVGIGKKEIIIKLTDYSGKNLLSEKKQINRQRKTGKLLIVVNVPYKKKMPKL